MAFRWRADDGQTLNAGLVAAIFQEIRTCIALYFCDFSGGGGGGGGSGPPVPPSGSALGLAKLWLFLSLLWHISYLIPISSIITVLGSILQVRMFAIALSKPPLFSLTVWLFDVKWRDTGLKPFSALMSVKCPRMRSLIVLLVCPTYCRLLFEQLIKYTALFVWQL